MRGGYMTVDLLVKSEASAKAIEALLLADGHDVVVEYRPVFLWLDCQDY